MRRGLWKGLQFEELLSRVSFPSEAHSPPYLTSRWQAGRGTPGVLGVPGALQMVLAAAAFLLKKIMLKYT